MLILFLCKYISIIGRPVQTSCRAELRAQKTQPEKWFSQYKNNILILFFGIKSILIRFENKKSVVIVFVTFNGLFWGLFRARPTTNGSNSRWCCPSPTKEKKFLQLLSAWSNAKEEATGMAFSQRVFYHPTGLTLENLSGRREGTASKSKICRMLSDACSFSYLWLCGRNKVTNTRLTVGFLFSTTWFHLEDKAAFFAHFLLGRMQEGNEW